MYESVGFLSNGTAVATVRLDDVNLLLADVLDDAERQFAERLRPPRRQRFLAGRIVLRVFLAEQAGVEPAALRANYRCSTCGGTINRVHGRPSYRLPTQAGSARVSLSRSGPWCLVACSFDPDVLGLGVDLQDSAATDFAGFAAVALTPAELEVLQRAGNSDACFACARLWARKEAVLKALGVGLMVMPSSVDITRFVPVVTAELGRNPGLTVQDINPNFLGLPADFAAALATNRST